MTKQIAILRGDGIGPEIVAQAVRVLDKLIEQGLDVQYQYAPWAAKPTINMVPPILNSRKISVVLLMPFYWVRWAAHNMII